MNLGVDVQNHIVGWLKGVYLDDQSGTWIRKPINWGTQSPVAGQDGSR